MMIFVGRPVKIDSSPEYLPLLNPVSCCRIVDFRLVEMALITIPRFMGSNRNIFKIIAGVL